MAKNLISFNPVSKKIEELSTENKGKIWNNIIDEMNMSLSNYSKNLSIQEYYIFNDSKELNFQIMDENSFHKIILNFLGNLSESMQEINNQKIDTNKLEGEKLEINYIEICAITKFIIYLISKHKKESKTIFNFYSQSILPKISAKKNDMEQKLLILLEKTKNVKILSICLSDKNYKQSYSNKEKLNINLYVIQLFCYFFRAIFTNILVINIDLNIYEINKKYNTIQNPYWIKEDKILKDGETYKSIFLGNLIFMNRLSELPKITEIDIQMSDSYQIELHQLMTKYFQNNSLNENERRSNPASVKYSPIFKNNFPYFQHILSKKNQDFYKFDMKFNSLDPLLFSYVNIVLFHSTSLANISLTFFNFDKINPRKTLINSYYYNYYTEGKKNPLITKFGPDRTNIKWDKDSKIYFSSINTLKDYDSKNLILLKDEVVLDELFPYFNYNLNTLLTILEDKFQEKTVLINCLKLDFTLSGNGNINLNLFNNYNSSIICFLINLFSILEANKELSQVYELIILLDDYTDEKKFIIKSINKKFPNHASFNLKQIKLTQFTINLSNITNILPFHNFPMEKLTELNIDNLSFNDLNNILYSLTQYKDLFPKLKTLSIGLNYMLEDFLPKIKLLLKEYIIKKIYEFTLKIPSYISYDDIIDLINIAKRNQNSKADRFIFKLSNDILSPIIGQDSFASELNKFQRNSKKKFSKMNIIAKFILKDLNTLVLSMKTLEKKDINYYLTLIYCFNKLYNKNGDKKEDKNQNQKIFEKIFYYMGKFKKEDKKIDIEII